MTNAEFNKLKLSAKFILSKIKKAPDVAITLGSGLANFADRVKNPITIPYKKIPGFVRSTVVGHPGELVYGDIAGKKVLLLRGRFHYYEGYKLSQVVYPTRVIKLLGCDTLVLTNAAGGFGDGMKPGHLMVIQDHINLSGLNPLVGPNIDSLGPRFPDMTEVYDSTLREKMKSILTRLKIPHSEGVYCGLSGPTYETPSEIQYLKKLGGAAVGMSTVPEAIAARHAGLRLAGLSCITNLGAGLGTGPLLHEDVTTVARQIETAFSTFLTAFIDELPLSKKQLT